MPFLTEAEPERGVALPVAPGVRRMVAANPGPMTYRGTNTYLIETKDGLVVLDPGPDGHPEHVDAIRREAGGAVSLILVSHHHPDHIGGVRALQAATGAATAGFREQAVPEFEPDLKIGDADTIAGMLAIHTPGHAPDHLCFALAGTGGEKILFSADHVMSWSSTVVSPPSGNMRDYFGSLEKLLRRQDDLYLPGHGPKLPQPRDLVRELLHHREERERAILAALARGNGASAARLVEAIYVGIDPRLHRAAERNVLAHLLKLEADGRVERDGERWRAGA